MKKTIMIALALALLVLSACSTPPTGNVVLETQETIKIGIMSITTGDIAFLGEDITTSAQVALQDLGRDDVELIVENVDFGNGAQAIAAYNKLVGIDGVDIIIGGVVSDDTLTVAPLLESTQTVMITPLTGGSNIDEASPYLFRNGPSDVLAGIDMAEDFNELGIDNIAIITDNGAYTLDIRTHFLNEYKGTVVVNELIDPQERDLRTVATKIKASDADAIVLLSAAGITGNILMKQLGELGNELPVYMNFFAYNGDTAEIAGDYAEGIYVYDIDHANTQKSQEFFVDFEQLAGHKPTYEFHQVNTYDLIKMSLEAIDAVGYDGAAIREYLLANIQDWDGIARKVTFDANGNDMSYGFRMTQIQNGELVIV